MKNPRLEHQFYARFSFFGIYRAQNVNNAMVSNVAVAVKEKWSIGFT